MAALRYVWIGRDQGFEALNEALIALLPKKDGAMELKDFRPVSLVHSFARLLTKIMARRLAPRMHELVDGNQMAFIRGRCIQDNFLLVKESAKLLHRKRFPSLLLKVDIAKAFDNISWPFLLSVLRHRGTKEAEITAVWGVLNCFGATSGLKANFAKSFAAPIQCSDETLQVAVTALPCPISSLPCTYLGLPLSLSKPRKAYLQVVIDNLAAKLPHWKARLMSREGRLVYV
ncbi:hypothetical protein ACQ4PT_004437 [Festuca glaucescens]